MRVLHIEVGGTYGGSVKALALFLEHSDPKRFEHDVIFYYPTSGTENFASVARRSTNLGQKIGWLGPGSARMHPSASGIVRGVWGVTRKSATLRQYVDVLRALPLVPKLYRLINARKYDVIHVNNTFTYQPASIIASVVAGRPVVGHVRAPVFDSGAIARALGARCAAIVTVNRNLADQLSAAGIPGPIHTVWDSIERPCVPNCADIDKARGLISSPCEVLVGSVGRLAPNKGFDTFIEAARLVVERDRDVHFVISGEGPERSRLENMIVRLGLAERFSLLGFYPDACALMAAMDVFVCSSLWEGGPLALLEAMSLGTAVVTTAVGLAPEIVAQQRNGIIVPPAQPAAMADAIATMIARGHRGRREMGAAGRQTALRFTDLTARSAELDSILTNAVNA